MRLAILCRPPLGPGRTPAPPTRASRLTDAPGASRTPTPKGAAIVPVYADTWRRGLGRRTPLRKNTPRGQRCTSTAAGTADRWPEGHGPREPRPTFRALIDAAQPDTWKDCRQREPGRAGSAGTPRRNPAQLAGHQDRHPVPPQRRTGPAPHPFRLQPLKDCRPTPPGGWIYPQPLRPDPMQPARQLPPGHQRPGTRCSRKASRPTRPRPPATSQPAAGPSWTPQHGEPRPLRIWANGHTSACAPVPAPAQDLPERTGPARPAGHLNAWADPAAIVSAAASQRHPWTRGAGPLPDTSTPTAGGARKKHQTRRNGA